jgi:hypothetical protein
MKKISMILILVAISVAGFSQKAFNGFFKPVDKQLFTNPLNTKAVVSAWLFRPVVTITAMQFTFADPITVTSLSSMGTGISYQHFISQNDVPYNNFGINGLLLFSQDLGDVEPAKLSFAVTGNFFNGYLSIGAGYSLGDKKFFALTGIALHFN